MCFLKVNKHFYCEISYKTWKSGGLVSVEPEILQENLLHKYLIELIKVHNFFIVISLQKYLITEVAHNKTSFQLQTSAVLYIISLLLLGEDAFCFI